MAKRKVIIITDGDRVARKVVERVAKNVGGRAISLSAGNPTPVSGAEIADAVKETPYDPVLVMVDDCGSQQKASGEDALEILANHPEIDILGVVAVASNTARVDGVPVTASVTREGRIIPGPVDKDGLPESAGHHKVEGDTVDVINRLNIPVVIGIGDLGKMDDADLEEDGARITTIAVQEVLKRSDFTPQNQFH
jgi:stage V sporulation protein AE